MTVPVVLDTDIYSHLIVSPARSSARGLPVEEWRQSIAGRPVLISFQTRAELISGYRAAGWGHRRSTEAIRTLDDVQTIGVDRAVLDAFVELTVACRSAGHALQAKVHTADRWVAACAISRNLPLFAADRIYESAPGLDLFAP